MQSEPRPPANRWPSQIKYIVGNEACERFSYYGMRSVLAGYITGAGRQTVKTVRHRFATHSTGLKPRC